MGASAFSASAVAAGIAVGPDSSSGARIGGAISTAEAIAACQSPVDASATAVGWVPGAADGNTARATPAASAAGSAPGTRVVFLVARAGKPSFCTACGALDGIPIVTVVVVEQEDAELLSRLVPPPQPASGHGGTQDRGQLAKSHPRGR